MDRFTPQYRPLDILITNIHELCPRKRFDMVDTRSNMQLSGLYSKPRGRKILRNLIGSSIGYRFCPPPGSVQNKTLLLDQFYGTYHINCEQKKKSEIKMTKISNARNRTTKPRADQI